MTRLFAISVLCIFGSAAAAATCTFSSECMDADACQDTNFSIEANLGAKEFVTDFGTYPIDWVGAGPEQVTFLAQGDGARYLLTFEGGDARLSVHMQGPMMINYSGTCEGDWQ